MKTTIEQNAIKIVLIVIFAWGLFFGGIYVKNTVTEIRTLQSQMAESLLEQLDMNTEVASLTFDSLIQIITQLEEVVKNQNYIIDQNRDKIANEEIIKQDLKKPSYEEIKSHSVWIEGCSNNSNRDDEVSYPVNDSSSCWGGTGVVIKIKNNETYILTNNHVSGKGEKNVKLYVKNDVTDKLIKAEIVAQHTTVDAAVIKIATVLPNKKVIPGIASTQIQDPVYVVGNPLGVRDIYTEGIVAGYEGIDLLIQMPCIYGNSGSGVFNKDGKLVGLVYALEVYPGFMGIPEARITHSLVVDNLSIKMFLKDLGLYNE